MKQLWFHSLHCDCNLLFYYWKLRKSTRFLFVKKLILLDWKIYIYTPFPHSTFTLLVGVCPLSHQLKKSHLHEKFKINTLYEILIKNKQKSKLYIAKWRKSTCTLLQLRRIVIIQIHLHKMEINAWSRD